MVYAERRCSKLCPHTPLEHQAQRSVHFALLSTEPCSTIWQNRHVKPLRGVQLKVYLAAPGCLSVAEIRRLDWLELDLGRRRTSCSHVDSRSEDDRTPDGTTSYQGHSSGAAAVLQHAHELTMDFVTQQHSSTAPAPETRSTGYPSQDVGRSGLHYYCPKSGGTPTSRQTT